MFFRVKSNYYFCNLQLVFDPRDGATPTSLYEHVSETENLSRDRLVIAKYFSDKYEWMVIRDTDSTKVWRKTAKGGGKKRVKQRRK